MKNVIDAVIELKGDLSNSFNFRGDEVNLTQGTGILIAINYVPDYGLICTIKDFNACIDELSTNYGRMPIGLLELWQQGLKKQQENKADIDWSLAPEGATHHLMAGVNGVMGAFYRLDNSGLHLYHCKRKKWVDGLNKTSWLVGNKLITTKPTKVIYTQDQCDAGELPPIGLLIQIRTDYGDDNEFYNGILLAENKGVIWFDDDKYGGRLHSRNEVTLQPIDTRTDTEKAVDDMAVFVGNCESDFGIIQAIKAGKIHGVTWSGKS